MPSDTTTPPAPSSVSSVGGSPPLVPTLILAAYAPAPSRVGWSFPFPDLHLEHTFGRGPGDGRDLRVDLAPRTPFFTGPVAAFDESDLSRRLLQITPRPFGFDVRSLTTRRMCLAGVETKEGGIAFGETIQIDDKILLYAARRPARHEVRYLPHDLRPRFGQADPLGIIGESHALYAALDLLALAARARIHVLLHGETGTGKELFARLLHALSDRAQGPFVSRNAAAFPDTLIEAELFGNARNFPQFPMAERAGMIALGNGGFVFLDEIGRLSPRLQGVLLRALDPGGEYWRLGEEKSRRSDFRMVAATNAALDTLAHDLVPRFKQIIELPPLRDRLEDVPLLVREMALTHVDADPLLRARFVEERPDGTRFVRIGLDFLDALLVSDHPLNVRGLEAMVLTSIGWSRGSRLRAYPGLVESTHRRERTKRAPYVGPGGHLRDLMPDEVELLRTIVDGKHGSKARAARVFGCSRHQITRAMDRYGITAAPGSEEPDEGE